MFKILIMILMFIVLSLLLIYEVDAIFRDYIKETKGEDLKPILLDMVEEVQ